MGPFSSLIRVGTYEQLNIAIVDELGEEERISYCVCYKEKLVREVILIKMKLLLTKVPNS